MTFFREDPTLMTRRCGDVCVGIVSLPISLVFPGIMKIMTLNK